MANYCPDEPKERGFWYDMEITRKTSKQVCAICCGVGLDGANLLCGPR